MTLDVGSKGGRKLLPVLVAESKPTEKDGLMPAVRLGDNEAHENNGRGTQRPAR